MNHPTHAAANPNPNPKPNPETTFYGVTFPLVPSKPETTVYGMSSQSCCQVKRKEPLWSRHLPSMKSLMDFLWVEVDAKGCNDQKTFGEELLANFASCTVQARK